MVKNDMNTSQHNYLSIRLFYNRISIMASSEPTVEPVKENPKKEEKELDLSKYDLTKPIPRVSVSTRVLKRKQRKTTNNILNAS